MTGGRPSSHMRVAIPAVVDNEGQRVTIQKAMRPSVSGHFSQESIADREGDA